MDDDLKPWRTVASRHLLTAGPWLTVRAETIELPDGRRVDDFVQIEQPDFVCIFPEAADGRVITLRQYRHGPRRVCLTFPGGHLDIPGEPHLETAKRELMEETGCVADSWQYLGAYVTHANARGATSHMYRALGCRPVAEPDSGDLEDTRIVLMTRAEIMAAAARGDLAILNQMALLAMVTSADVMAAVG